MIQVMGRQSNDFSHPDSLECYTCHTSWRQTCFGCHVRVNDDGEQYNPTTGEISRGAIIVSRDDFSIDFFTSGVNDRGKISPLCNSMSVFVSYRNEGQFEYEEQVRQTTEGTKGFGWNPFQHHTVSKIPMNCDTCHLTGSLDSPTNAVTLSQTYGFGTGEVLITDGDGVDHDVGAFLDAEGNLTSTFPHPGTGPVSTETREHALSQLVVPHPR